MRRFVVLIVSVSAAACTRSGGSAPPPAPAPVVSEIQQDNDRSARAVLAFIAGREQLPAREVFKNVNYLANVPASTFLSIMNTGYAKALGVRCAHCHVDGNYASDDKRPKRAAREMQIMHRGINQELAKMQNIRTPVTENRSINCFTCHRGVAVPR
jgi:hypothetical protein